MPQRLPAQVQSSLKIGKKIKKIRERKMIPAALAKTYNSPSTIPYCVAAIIHAQQLLAQVTEGKRARARAKEREVCQRLPWALYCQLLFLQYANDLRKSIILLVLPRTPVGPFFFPSLFSTWADVQHSELCGSPEHHRHTSP